MAFFQNSWQAFGCLVKTTREAQKEPNYNRCGVQLGCSDTRQVDTDLVDLISLPDLG